MPWTEFTGFFDGGGHTVTIRSLSSDTLSEAGLFGVIAFGGVKNLSVAGDISSSADHALMGAIAGITDIGVGDLVVIENCCGAARVLASGKYAGVGGIVGQGDL
jgi:hypothetical protein